MDTNQGANILVAVTHVKYDDHSYLLSIHSFHCFGGAFCYRNFVFLIL